MINTWLEINKHALINNLLEFKNKVANNKKIIAVVKANAYGHGLLEVVDQVKDMADYLAVYDFADALLLRQKKVKTPLLVLGRIYEDQIDLAIKNNIEVTVTTFDILKKVKRGLQVHICIDSGMGRDGFVCDDIESVVGLLQKISPLQIKGLYSHFASSDFKDFDFYTEQQIKKLLCWRDELRSAKIYPLLHIGGTAGSFFVKNIKDFDLVRVGIGLYGLWPSPELRSRGEVKLIPALTWKVIISEVKRLPKGSKISYGCTYSLQRDSKIAVVGIGYYDGISRVASNKAFAIVNGVKVPQIGRITTNLTIFDVTDVSDVKIGDVMTIIGKQGDTIVDADDWGYYSQSLNYEVVTKINSKIKRIVT